MLATCVYSLVDPELFAEEKPLVADRALERLVPDVHHTVLTQGALVDKGVPAHVASVRALARVKSNVTQQIAPG